MAITFNQNLSNCAKKEIKRIEWRIVKKIITLLRYDGRMGKTRLAMKCGMSYDKCVRYLEWLALLNLVSKETNNGHDLIILTKNGQQLFDKLIVNSSDLPKLEYSLQQ
jgi:predicted transcriptional regulator